jgi:hypothetical protein
MGAPEFEHDPDWFFKAVETESQEKRVEVEDCDVAYRRWSGDNGPGLLFIHGMKRALALVGFHRPSVCR